MPVPLPRGTPSQVVKQPTSHCCPHCGSESCYHCWECGADVWLQCHKQGCSGLRSPTIPICKACQGTGRSSGNKRCHPCNGTGRQGAYNDAGKPSPTDSTTTAIQDSSGDLTPSEHSQTDARPSPPGDTEKRVVGRDPKSIVPVDGDEMSSLWG